MSAQARIADALLRGVGGRTVLLHVPAAAVPGDVGEQTGLAEPGFQDVELGPVVFRRVRPKIATARTEAAAEYELLVSATAVRRAAGPGDGDAAVLFAQACGVLVDGMLLLITSATAVEGRGGVLLYRLGLKSGAAQLT